MPARPRNSSTRCPDAATASSPPWRCAADGRAWTREVVSTVRMKRLSDEEINAYLASGDWQGKAGGYGIQGMAGAFVPWISGSFTGIVGLPLSETAGLLQAAGPSCLERRA